MKILVVLMDFRSNIFASKPVHHLQQLCHQYAVGVVLHLTLAVAQILRYLRNILPINSDEAD